jgi:hypothetical protein
VGTFYCYQQEILEKEPLDALACGLGKHDGLSLSKHMRSGTPKKTSNNWERSPISLEGIMLEYQVLDTLILHMY